MSWRTRLVAALVGCSAALLPAAAPASAAATYWTIYNPPARSGATPLCLTAGTLGGWATVAACDGSAVQDWTFSRGDVGEYLTNRGVPGAVLAISSSTAGGHLVLARRNVADAQQLFVAGDPLKAHHNHIRPQLMPTLCLETRPAGASGASVMLARCDTNPTGPQAWLSRFHGNH
jgi:hypothetical protein